MSRRIKDSNMSRTGNVTADSRLPNDQSIYLGLPFNKRLDLAIQNYDFNLYNLTNQSGATTLTNIQEVMNVTTAGTQTLPDATTSGEKGRVHWILNNSSGSFAINTSASQTIGGRASGAIVLQPRDYLAVISDASNWQILAKKQTEHLTQTSNNFAVNTLAASQNYADFVNNGLAISVGVWRVYAHWNLNSGTSGVNVAIVTNGQQTGVYASNGLDSTSQPNLLSTIGTVYGSSALRGNDAAVTGAHVSVSNNGGSRVIVQTAPIIFTFNCTTAGTLFPVASMSYSTQGDATAMSYISAERIW